MSISQWRPGVLTALSLPPKTVHVWRLYMDQPDSTVAIWRKSLSAAERERGDRFYFERDRRRFTISRVAVKHLLSRYAGIPVKDIVFHKGPYGKPYLTAEMGDGELQFNVSHSNEMALLAFTRNGELGVDVEYRKELSDLEGIVSNFFSPREITTLLGLPTPAERRIGFFNCWSRKEAYIKAIGKGLSQPLDGFDVTLLPGDSAELLYVDGLPNELSRWTMQNLEVGGEYAAAIIYEGDQTVIGLSDQYMIDEITHRIQRSGK